MKKVLFVNDERQMGGVSIVLEDILNNIDYKDKKIDLLILHNNGDRLKNIPKNINVIYGTKFFNTIDIPLTNLINEKKYKLIIKKIITSFLMKTNLIKYKIKQERKKILNDNYDIEIAFKHGFTTLFTYYGNSKKKINWVHCDCNLNDPAQKYQTTFKKIINKFDYNILLTNSLKKDFEKKYNCSNCKVIKNIIDDKKILELSKNTKTNTNGLLFVSVGRLSREKGFENLIEAFYLLKKDDLLHDIKLEIYGDGDLKYILQDLIDKYDLNNYIMLKGRTDNPYIPIKNANMYILSSLNEGYGLVLIESFICKTPVISTDVISARELIDKKHGIITENSINGLYKAIKKVITNKNIIKELTENLKDYKYDNPKIIEEIEELLK